jgi:hypothetical protein
VFAAHVVDAVVGRSSDASCLRELAGAVLDAARSPEGDDELRLP